MGRRSQGPASSWGTIGQWALLENGEFLSSEFGTWLADGPVDGPVKHCILAALGGLSEFRKSTCIWKEEVAQEEVEGEGLGVDLIKICYIHAIFQTIFKWLLVTWIHLLDYNHEVTSIKYQRPSHQIFMSERCEIEGTKMSHWDVTS